MAATTDAMRAGARRLPPPVPPACTGPCRPFSGYHAGLENRRRFRPDLRQMELAA